MLGLGQLRFLENSCSIKRVIVDIEAKLFELNNPEDVVRIEKVINENIIQRKMKMKTLKLFIGYDPKRSCFMFFATRNKEVQCLYQRRC